MATFFENLWQSIFTPGTTPTLLIATNATFASLQLVLGLLLVATRSIHFVVLSAICGGLWWAINWFALELKKAEKAEEEAGRLRKHRSMASSQDRERDTTDYTGDDSTETETEVESGFTKPLVHGGPLKAQAVMESAAEARDQTRTVVGGVRIRGGPSKIQGVIDSAAAAEADREEAASSGIEIRGGPDKIAAILAMSEEGQSQSGEGPETKRTSLGEHGTSESTSTDSEWEKVSNR
jgi:hypothetical protein